HTSTYFSGAPPVPARRGVRLTLEVSEARAWIDDGRAPSRGTERSSTHAAMDLEGPFHVRPRLPAVSLTPHKTHISASSFATVLLPNRHPLHASTALSSELSSRNARASLTGRRANASLLIRSTPARARSASAA